ncbi:polyprenyl diphosphate synthase, partial [Pelagibacteraceae bacterium]|nr:polyprenyl diphosphate synthase [Pelagibacteraceae bacterium]
MNKLNHVAFIMDGNGRWGKKRNKGRNFGHLNGVKTVKKIVESSIKLKIPIVTFYVFSTENWKRPKSEINFLFKLIVNYFKDELNRVIVNGIKINLLGKINKLPSKIKKTLTEASKLTKNNKKIIVNLAINYGSKDEIINAATKTKKKINIQTLEKNLYTKNLKNPDILIRTGGHKRLSNFMLWQL